MPPIVIGVAERGQREGIRRSGLWKSGALDRGLVSYCKTILWRYNNKSTTIESTTMPKGKPAASPSEKSKANPRSMAAAIAAFCYHDCAGETATNSHATKYFIGQCKNEKCHLWPHRPWVNSTGGNMLPKTREAIKKTPPL